MKLLSFRLRVVGVVPAYVPFLFSARGLYFYSLR